MNNLYNDLFKELYYWIINRNDLYIIQELNDFKKSFYQFCNNKRYTETYDTLIDEYYYSDIIDLYMRFKNITKIHGSQLFHNRGDTSDDLYCFLTNYGYVDDEIVDDENNTEDEETFDYYE